ncbi:MAG: PEP-CTERM sorting domain-containing protein [Acidobacteria bacterium]|nr:PEP-CTERM sorting domain-containing protein [Acidobacteriota bacterium]
MHYRIALAFAFCLSMILPLKASTVWYEEFDGPFPLKDWTYTPNTHGVVSIPIPGVLEYYLPASDPVGLAGESVAAWLDRSFTGTQWALTFSAAYDMAWGLGRQESFLIFFGDFLGSPIPVATASNHIRLFRDKDDPDPLRNSFAGSIMEEGGSFSSFNDYNIPDPNPYTFTVVRNNQQINIYRMVGDTRIAMLDYLFSDPLGDVQTVRITGANFAGTATAYYDYIHIDIVPEPSTLLLTVGGILAVALLLRRRVG